MNRDGLTPLRRRLTKRRELLGPTIHPHANRPVEVSGEHLQRYLLSVAGAFDVGLLLLGVLLPFVFPRLGDLIRG